MMITEDYFSRFRASPGSQWHQNQGLYNTIQTSKKQPPQYD